MAGIDPAAGSVVSNLAVVTVTFNRAVVGVQAEDLLLNGSGGHERDGVGGGLQFWVQPTQPGGSGGELERGAQHHGFVGEPAG